MTFETKAKAAAFKGTAKFELVDKQGDCGSANNRKALSTYVRDYVKPTVTESSMEEALGSRKVSISCVCVCVRRKTSERERERERVSASFY